MLTKDLIEKRNSVLLRMREAHEGERADDFSTAETELRSIDAALDRQRLIDEADRRATGEPVGRADLKLSTVLRNNFHLIRAMAGAAGIQGVDWGFEREMQSELAKRAGKSAQGVYVPTEIFEERVLTTTAPAGGRGGNLIQTDNDGSQFIDRMRAALVTGQLGATSLNGLTGNLDVPRLKASATSGWVAENTALTASDH